MARERVRAALGRAGIEAVEFGVDEAWVDAVAGMQAVVAVGGDGTVRSVAARLAGGVVPLAIVPAGTMASGTTPPARRAATERTVPSPPTATTACIPATASTHASSTPNSTASMPARPSAARTRSRATVARPRPAAALLTSATRICGRVRGRRRAPRPGYHLRRCASRSCCWPR